MKKITIIGAGMMGSALAFPAAENGHEVHIVGTCLDDEIIDGYIKTGKHEKFCRPFPENVQYHYSRTGKRLSKALTLSSEVCLHSVWTGSSMRS